MISFFICVYPHPCHNLEHGHAAVKTNDNSNSRTGSPTDCAGVAIAAANHPHLRATHPILAPGTHRVPRRDPFWQRFLVIVVLVTVLSLVGALLSSYALFAGSETIFPAVSAVGVNLGGMTQPEAIIALQQVAQTPNMTVQAGSARQMVSLAQLVDMDVAGMVSEAYERGRDPGNWRELPQAFLLGLDMAPIWQFDPLIAQTTLAAIATQAHIPPTPADLVYASGQVQITPGQPGSQLDIPAGFTGTTKPGGPGGADADFTHDR